MVCVLLDASSLQWLFHFTLMKTFASFFDKINRHASGSFGSKEREQFSRQSSRRIGDCVS